MKKIVLFAMGLVMSMTTLAQDEIERPRVGERSSGMATVRGDLVSSYIWRGQDLGSTAIQPTLGVGYKGLSLTAWGSYGLVNADDVKEFDLTLDYTIGGLSIGITDSFSIPIFGQVVANPCSQKAYLVLGFTLQP